MDSLGEMSFLSWLRVCATGAGSRKKHRIYRYAHNGSVGGAILDCLTAADIEHWAALAMFSPLRDFSSCSCHIWARLIPLAFAFYNPCLPRVCSEGR